MLLADDAALGDQPRPDHVAGLLGAARVSV